MMTSIGSGSPEPEAALAGVLDVTLESSGSGGYGIGGGLFCYSSRPSHYLSRFHGSTSVEHIILGAPIEGEWDNPWDRNRVHTRNDDSPRTCEAGLHNYRWSGRLGSAAVYFSGRPRTQWPTAKWRP